MALFDEDQGLGDALREVGETDYVEGRIKHIGAMKGVKGVILLNKASLPLRWSFEDTDDTTVFKYISVVNQLVQKITTTLATLDKLEPDSWGKGEQGLKCLRVRSKKNEILTMPGDDYTLVVVQDLNSID
eukprot:TRINITY_DN33772_c0_g1_i1.p1 TRINITY_DN33772_c0_g1~~TRINITY_DN33772_c0_g1_i1.p1  ORF type:complete len:144 (+),score=49.35 TRINITY_DN33772_c0_g1_i1:45-434(+)